MRRICAAHCTREIKTEREDSDKCVIAIAEEAEGLGQVRRARS